MKLLRIIILLLIGGIVLPAHAMRPDFQTRMTTRFPGLQAFFDAVNQGNGNVAADILQQVQAGRGRSGPFRGLQETDYRTMQALIPAPAPAPVPLVIPPLPAPAPAGPPPAPPRGRTIAAMEADIA